MFELCKISNSELSVLIPAHSIRHVQFVEERVQHIDIQIVHMDTAMVHHTTIATRRVMEAIKAHQVYMIRQFIKSKKEKKADFYRNIWKREVI